MCVERFEHRHELGVHAAAVERRPAHEHEVVDEIGTIERQCERDGTAHAVSDEVSALDAKGVEHRSDVAGHALIGQRSTDVARVAVALQLDGNHLEVVSERGQQHGEAALDRAHRAMEQHERRPVSMALVVQVEFAYVDVARALRRCRDRTRRRRHACGR
jgi:hypothetical protein